MNDSRRFTRREIVRYVVIVVVAFAALYGVTRSSILVGDAEGYVDVARAGDPRALHYGEPSHFLQTPAARAVWIALNGAGLPVSLTAVFLAFSFAGTLAATVFIGLIAAELLHDRRAAWIGAVLFGTSLNVWTQANGELSGLALGFVSAGLFAALQGYRAAASLLWALAIACHSEYVLAAPAFALAIWWSRPNAAAALKLRDVVVTATAAVAVAAVIILTGSRALGAWTDAPSLSVWLWRSYEARRVDIRSAEIGRAFKGLITAYTVAGHYWRDVLTRRADFGNPAFVAAASVGLVVLLSSLLLIMLAVLRRQLALFALAWTLPVHTLFNWWFVPTVEKYHAAALPGLVLLITGGLVALSARLSPRSQCALCAVYVATCAGLNLFGAVLPMRHLGVETGAFERQLTQLNAEDGGRAVFVSCDDPKAVVSSGIRFLRVRSIWTGTIPEIQSTIQSWVRDRISAGDRPYLVGRWCVPEEWKTTASKAPFDLYFLSPPYSLVPTSMTDVPVTEPVPTNPFSWRRGGVVRLAPGGAPQP